MKPKYTDAHRYPNGYTPPEKTDVAKTFARIRKQIKDEQERAEAIQAEQIKKVQPMRRAK